MLNDRLSSVRDAAWPYWIVLSIILIVPVGVIVVAVLVYLDVVKSGFAGKTVWDWLDALVVPIVGVWLAGLFALAKARADQRFEDARELAEERTQVETLSTYLDCMQELMTADHLQSLKQSGPGRAVARARTFAALRILNGTRKGILLRFLHEAGLTQGEKSLELALADLTNVDLVGADLEGIDLEGANLSSGDLNGANLKRSRLKGCLLNDADLGNANLKGSTVDNAQLGRCRGLMGAQLPDGTTVDDAVWAELLELP